MDVSILKTLIYSDIFEYPLKAYEIGRWLIGQKANLNDLDLPLRELFSKKKIRYQKGYYFLKGKEILVSRRLRREKNAQKLLSKANLAANFLRIIPTVRLVGISGSLSMLNTEKRDDIDFFVVTSPNRLWLSRLLIGLVLEILGMRRRRSDSNFKAAGKVCVNALISEEYLEMEQKDIYTAHEILQLRVLWQRGECFQKLLFANSWVFDFLPNWISSEKTCKITKIKSSFNLLNLVGDKLEDLAKMLQKRSRETDGQERISERGLFFHPEDNRPLVLKEYQKKLNRYNLT